MTGVSMVRPARTVPRTPPDLEYAAQRTARITV